MQHKVFMSGLKADILLAYKQLHPQSEINVLISFGTRGNDYPSMLTEHRDKINSLILDSGAFTKNFSQSDRTAKITLAGFIAFLKRNYHFFDFVFNYDEDFQLDGSDINIPIMNKIEKSGFKVVPVVHDYIGEERDEISIYVQNSHPIIALGYSKHKKQNTVENIKTAIKPILAAGLKIHLLGLTSMDVLSQVPVHFSDSSSWAQEGLFGCVAWFNPDKAAEKIGPDRMYFKDTAETSREKSSIIDNHPDRDQFLEYVQNQLNLTYNDLYGINKDLCRELANVHYFVQLQNKIRIIQQELVKQPEWAPYKLN